jgi:hypothetical protein
VLRSAPSATSAALGIVDVLVVGTDHGLWRLSLKAGRGAWLGMAGYWFSDFEPVENPGVGSFASSELDIVATAPDQEAMHAATSTG